MNKITVLHIVRPAEGGMKEHLVSLVKNTNADEYRVLVACPADSSIYNDLQAAGIELFPISIVGELNPSKDWQSIKQLKEIMKTHKPDIVHTHSSKAGLVGRIAAKSSGIPVVIFTAHNSIFYDNMSRSKKLLFANVEKYLARYTDKIIAVSNALKDEIIQWEKIDLSKITVIQNGIDIKKFQSDINIENIRRELGLPADKPIVGAIARFAPQKGLKYFIEAASLTKRFDVQYVIIGDGPLREELEDQVKLLGMENNIKFLGLRRDIDKILQILDIFVLPSVTEGLPLTILEAMAAQKPIIATAVGGVPEVVIDMKTGLLVPSREPQILADAINKMLTDKQLAQELAQNGFELVKKDFSLEIMVEKISNLYSDLLSQTGKARGES